MSWKHFFPITASADVTYWGHMISLLSVNEKLRLRGKATSNQRAKEKKYSRKSWHFTTNTIRFLLPSVETTCNYANRNCTLSKFYKYCFHFPKQNKTKLKLSWKRRFWEQQPPTCTDVFYTPWPLMKLRIKTGFTFNKYSLYTAASGNLSPYGRQPKTKKKSLLAALPSWPAAIAGVDQTGGSVYTRRNIEHTDRNANLHHKYTTPRYSTCEYTQPAFSCHIHSQLCLMAVWWLILIKSKPKTHGRKQVEIWLPDIRMCDFCHCAKYNGQSMNTVNEGKR